MLSIGVLVQSYTQYAYGYSPEVCLCSHVDVIHLDTHMIHRAVGLCSLLVLCTGYSPKMCLCGLGRKVYTTSEFSCTEVRVCILGCTTFCVK